MHKIIQRILLTIWFFWFIYLLCFSVFTIAIGGRAFTGKYERENDKCYVWGGGEFSEVSKNIYKISYFGELGMYLLMVFAMIGWLFMDKNEDKLKKRTLPKVFFFKGQRLDEDRGEDEISGLVVAISDTVAEKIISSNLISIDKLRIATKLDKFFLRKSYLGKRGNTM